MPSPGSNRESEGESSRRGFLDRLIGVSAVAWAASIVYPILKYLKPLPQVGGAGPVALSPAEQAKLASEKFVIVPAGGKRALVFRNAAGELRAMDARCTHEGCTVQFAAAEGNIWCACHNGRFDLEGRVISGPPPRPLTVFSAEEKDGNVIVSLPSKNG
jgi:Rieske Fe-S protein